MTFNELCTNTTKFGALSVPAGRVEIAWTIDEPKQRLRLVWTESGGPAVEPPTRQSFGTRMMKSLGQQLNGQVQLAYEPPGFIYSLDVPLSSVAAASLRIVISAPGRFEHADRPAHVCLSGEDGSERRAVKVTRLTRN